MDFRSKWRSKTFETLECVTSKHVQTDVIPAEEKKIFSDIFFWWVTHSACQYVSNFGDFILPFKWIRVNGDTSRNSKLTAIFSDPIQHTIPRSDSDSVHECKQISSLVMCSYVLHFYKKITPCRLFSFFFSHFQVRSAALELELFVLERPVHS